MSDSGKYGSSKLVSIGAGLLVVLGLTGESSFRGSDFSSMPLLLSCLGEGEAVSGVLWEGCCVASVSSGSSCVLFWRCSLAC